MKNVNDIGIYNNIPDEFKEQDNWIVWRYEEVTNQKGQTKKTKKPYRADGRGCAKSNDPRTWSSFTEAVQAVRQNPDRYDGIGWCVPLEGEQTYWGFDLDDAIDPATGQFRIWDDAPLQPEEVFNLIKAGYAEVTPSGAGFRFYIVRSDGADVPAGAKQRTFGERNTKTNKEPGVEIYNRGRYFTFTGRKLPQCGDLVLDDIELCDRLHQTLTGSTTEKTSARQPKIAPKDQSGDVELVEDDLGEIAIRLAAERKPGSSRHHLVLGVTGVLLRNGFSLVEVETIVKYLVAIFSDEDSTYDGQQRLAKHLADVKSAAAKLQFGRGESVAGINHLINHDVFTEDGLTILRATGRSGQTAVMDLPFKFVLGKEKVFYRTKDKQGDEVLVPVCSPLTVSALVDDLEHDEHYIEITFTTVHGQERKLVIRRGRIASDLNGLIDEMMNLGFPGVCPGDASKSRFAELLIESKPSTMKKCVSKSGWHGETYVTQAGSVVGDLQVVLTGSPKPMRSSAGTLEEWQEHVAKYAPGNSRLAFSISAAFAAPMMRSVDAESGGFGFVNLTSCGKSTCQLAAASVYARASDYKESWRATSNGLEAVCARHNDALLILDEMGEADPRDVGEMVYMLANETGKARMSKNLTQRPSSRWKTLALGSGEKTLEQFMSAAGQTIKGGQSVRYVEIPADAGKGMGVFETLHDQPSSKALAETIARNSNTHYGTALPAFLSYVVQDKVQADRRMKRLYDMFLQKVEKHIIGTASEVGRVANRFALVAAAGELATMYGVTGWEPGSAFRAAEVCLLAWLSNRGGSGASDIERGIERIKHFILSEGSRFQGEHAISSPPRLAGYVFGETPMKADERKNGKTWAILPQVFREIIKDFDADAILKELSRRNVLITNEGRLTHKKKFGGVLQRTYHITAKLFDDAETSLAKPRMVSAPASASAA
jgi:uncharacterized protein (DUF927 family)